MLFVECNIDEEVLISGTKTKLSLLVRPVKIIQIETMVTNIPYTQIVRIKIKLALT